MQFETTQRRLYSGNICSKDYPKFLLRCVPESYCINSNLKTRILKIKTKNDKGYSWS